MLIHSTVTVLTALLMVLTASAADLAIHPEPKQPTLIPSTLLDEFKKQIPAPPAVKSAGQKSDEATLLEFQKARTPKDCERAKSEVYVSLSSFYGKPYGSLTPEQVGKLGGFFETIRNDADFYIQAIKKQYPRTRPFGYLTDIQPCVPQEVTGSFPSGHATLARLYSLILSDFYPAQKKIFETRAGEIAKDRVLSGMHHPTDIEAGKKLGQLIYDQLKKSKKFNDELASLKK